MMSWLLSKRLLHLHLLLFRFTAGGGGGGGGGGGSSIFKLSLSGFSNNTPLNIGSNGVILAAAELQTKDGKTTLNIANSTKLLSKMGSALSTLTIDVGVSPPATPAGNSLLADFDLGPEGSNFNPPLTLTLKYDTGTLPAGASENDLYLANWDGENWANLNSQVDTTDKTVSARISHFSQYALLIKVPPPSQFALSDLKVIPAEVSPNNSLTIQMTVSNTSVMPGQYNVNLKINNLDEDKQQVSLNARPKQYRIIPGEKKPSR